MDRTEENEEEKSKWLQKLVDSTSPLNIHELDISEFQSPVVRKLIELRQTDIEEFKRFSISTTKRSRARVQDISKPHLCL